MARLGRALVEKGRGSELGELFVAEFGGGMDAVRQSAIEAQLRTLGPEQYRQMYDQARLLVDNTAARFRSASFEIVPAGHFLHFERPEIVDTYAAFLTSAT